MCFLSTVWCRNHNFFNIQQRRAASRGIACHRVNAKQDRIHYVPQQQPEWTMLYSEPLCLRELALQNLLAEM